MKYTSSSSKGERASLTDNLIHLRRSSNKRRKLKKPSSDLKRIRNQLFLYITINKQQQHQSFKDPELSVFKEIGKFYKKRKSSINEEKENIVVNNKRKIEEDRTFEKRYKLEEEKVIKMYDYRPTAASIKNDSEYISSKSNEEDEENMINAFYQQRYLGGSNNSIATLCNIGNSCYLNSVIYTLRFAPKFLHKLHHLCDDLQYVYQKIGQNKLKSSSLGRNVSGLQGQSGRSWSSKDLASLSGINSSSDHHNNSNHSNNINQQPVLLKNNRQVVTEKLHELYQNLHRNESIDTSDSFHAGNFLQAIQDVSSIFEGNQQQDAHELLMCILDSIRETCSTLSKTLKENPEILIIQNSSQLNAHDGNSDSTLPPNSSTSNTNATPTTTLQSSSQSIKSIFSRKIKRKDTLKSKNGSPMKENLINSCSEMSSIEESANESNMSSSSNHKSSLNSISNNINSNNSESCDSNGVNESDKEKINETIKRLGLDFFTEDFEGITLSTTKCLTCETVSEQKETMIDISIPLASNDNNQPLDPQLFFQNSCITREYFRVENHYRCDKCCGYTEAIRSISFEVLPRLLILHIKRFSGGMEKISSYSPTPFILKCFCNKCYKKRDEDKLHIYKLYSVITHVGATMSVGHYIAYTCSLDIYNEYVSCGHDKRRLSLSNAAAAANKTKPSTISSLSSSTSSGSEKNSGLMKKLIYGRNKASSSGDMSKNLKPINGLSKIMMNGFEKLNLNSEKLSATNGNSQLINGTNSSTHKLSTPPKTVCNSANCCGIYIKDFTNIVENYHNNNNVLRSERNGVDKVDNNSGDETTNNSMTSDYESASSQQKPSLNDLNQKVWYMCDDDKIKIMTQREFEEALSKNQKVMITPYLLFYARYDVNKQTSNSVDHD